MKPTLDELRAELDQLDSAILELLEKRIKVTDQVGEYKKTNNVSILQPDRENAQRTSLAARAVHPILKEGVWSIFQQIIEVAKFGMHVQHAPSVPFQSVGIIGLGMMGGSLAKLLKLKSPPITIATIARQSQDTQDAVTAKIVDTTYQTLSELMNAVELLIIASPIDTVIPLAQEVASQGSSLKKKLIVIDIASVKEPIARVFEALTDEKIEFVATHPMAGSEKTGFQNAQAGLYLQKPWIISAHAKNQPQTLQLVSGFIDSCTSRPIMLPANEHDKAVALVSHLVFILSTYIFAFPYDTSPRSLELAGAGFESTTRLASASPTMHQQIILNNVANIKMAIQNFIVFLQQNPINEQNLLNFFEKYKKGRDEFMASRSTI